MENLVNNVIWEEGKGEVNQTRESAFVQEYPSFVTIDAGETMTSDVKYALDIPDGAKSHVQTIVSHATLDAAAQAAFRSGAVEWPRGWTGEISVNATGVRLSAWKKGTVLILR